MPRSASQKAAQGKDDPDAYVRQLVAGFPPLSERRKQELTLLFRPAVVELRRTGRGRDR